MGAQLEKNFGPGAWMALDINNGESRPQKRTACSFKSLAVCQVCTFISVPGRGAGTHWLVDVRDKTKIPLRTASDTRTLSESESNTTSL